MRCFYCMEEYDEDLDVICPYCGNDVVSPDNDSYCLAAGTVLNRRYVLGRVLGDGGFGITYIGYDKALKRKVAVKEYFPNECVTRQRGETEVAPHSGERGERYARGLKSFQGEAQRLAGLGSIEGVVNVYDVFNENGTTYIVMEYLSGENVMQMMEGHKFLGFGKTMNIIVSVLKSLRKVHEAGVIHRDITPKNIMKTKEGKIVLIDFGAAKTNAVLLSRTASFVLTQGFAPIEQCAPGLPQGTWTDVYAVAATMYYMLTGIVPDAANARVISDTLILPSEVHPGLPEELDNIVIKALAVKPEDRTQTADELLEEIWKLRNPQNTTRRGKTQTTETPSAKNDKKSLSEKTTIEKPAANDRTKTVNLPPTPIDKIKAQKKSGAEQPKQWKNYAGTETVRTDNFPETTKERPGIITITTTHEKSASKEPLVPKNDKPSSKRKVPVPLIAAVVLLIGVLGTLIGVGYHDKQNKVEIPDFKGQKIDSVLSDRNYEFDFKTIYTYNPDTELDVIISQSPLPSTRHVDKTTEVRLTVNSKETEVSVPVLTKMSEQVAVNTLKSLYLESEVVIVNNDEFSDGLVVSSEPSTGAKVKVGSVVTIYVAQNSVAVPTLYGKTLQQATDELSALGLALGSEVTYDYSDEYETGCVMSQGIEPGTKVVKGTSVSVMISSGKPVPVTLSVTVSLDGLSTPFSVKAVCDGVTEYERKRYSLVFEDSEEITITRGINEGTKTVEIYIDDELYQTYLFNFESGDVEFDEQFEVSASKRKTTESKSESSAVSSQEKESDSEEFLPAPVSSVYSEPESSSATVFPMTTTDTE